MEAIKENHNREIDLYVFNEMALIGGDHADYTDLSLAEDLSDSLILARLTRFCMQKKVNILIGLTEKEASERFITHLVIHSDGSLHTQRKIFPHNLAKSAPFSSGKTITPFDFNGFRTGILACADLLLPEGFMMAGRKECHLILSPMGSFSTETAKSIKPIFQSRALELSAPVLGVFANSGNNEKELSFLCFDENGNEISTEAEKTVCHTEVTNTGVNKRWGGFQKRREYLI